MPGLLILRKSEEIFIGLNGETIGVKLNAEDKTLKTLGHYSNDGEIVGIGWKKLEDIGGEFI